MLIKTTWIPLDQELLGKMMYSRYSLTKRIVTNSTLDYFTSKLFHFFSFFSIFPW